MFEPSKERLTMHNLTETEPVRHVCTASHRRWACFSTGYCSLTDSDGESRFISELHILQAYFGPQLVGKN